MMSLLFQEILLSIHFQVLIKTHRDRKRVSVCACCGEITRVVGVRNISGEFAKMQANSSAD